MYRVAELMYDTGINNRQYRQPGEEAAARGSAATHCPPRAGEGASPEAKRNPIFTSLLVINCFYLVGISVIICSAQPLCGRSWVLSVSRYKLYKHTASISRTT